jgi:hypothetical protein
MTHKEDIERLRKINDLKDKQHFELNIMKESILLQIEMFEQGLLSPYELVKKIKEILQENKK